MSQGNVSFGQTGSSDNSVSYKEYFASGSIEALGSTPHGRSSVVCRSDHMLHLPRNLSTLLLIRSHECKGWIGDIYPS